MVLTAVFAAFTVSTLYRLYIFCRKSKKFFLNNTDKKLIQNIKNITLPAVSYFSQELRAMTLLKNLLFWGYCLKESGFIYNLFCRAFLCYSFNYRAAKAYFTYASFWHRLRQGQRLRLQAVRKKQRCSYCCLFLEILLYLRCFEMHCHL